MTNLIFDYDGTLNNCMKTYKPSFLKAYSWLVENNYAQPHEFLDSEISQWLGFTGSAMWAAFQPQLPVEVRDYCRKMISSETDRLIQNGSAALFEGAEEVLTKLCENGYTLIYLSNCRRHYLKNHNDAFHLDRWFSFFYCAEDFDFIPKYEIFRKFKNNHNGEYIVIGDRFHDIETASLNSLKSIGCAYGYGNADELRAADIIVNSIYEIPEAAERLSNI